MERPKACPHCQNDTFIRQGKYFVRYSRSYRQRYKCQTCLRTFSRQTTSPTWYQKKPFLNEALLRLLCHGNTQRGSARLLGCTKNTVERKFTWLCRFYTEAHSTYNADVIQIDEMESIEHTKLKPITIPLAVSERYQIISIQTGKIPAKGHLAKFAIKKYGPRENEREMALHLLFQDLKSKLKISPNIIRTDGASIYKSLVKEYFPQSHHETFLARDLNKKKRELVYESSRKKAFDPIFALNQRCAKLRADIKRLARRSWCTTKRIENLQGHLALYQVFNNQNLS